MSRVRVAAFSVSLDGFGAGLEQSLDNPLGLRGPTLHKWAFKTKVFREMFGEAGGSEGIDNSYAQRSFENVGAWIMGRNMFGPVRGPWADHAWRGWWGENPPYHTQVYVLTHYPREPLVMNGGTTFHFINDGIESALLKAKSSARERDVRIGGGVATIREFLQAGLIDEIHLAYSPVFLGAGENLLAGVDVYKLGFNLTEHALTEDAVHVVLKK